MDIWNTTFKGMNKSKLSASQCNAAGAIFGNTPDVAKFCGQQSKSPDLDQLSEETYKQIMTEGPIAETVQALQDNLTVLVNELMALDKRLEALETDEQERKDNLFFMPRATRALYGEAWQSGTKTEADTPGSSAASGSQWTDATDAFTKIQKQSENVYQRHDLRDGRVPF